MRAVAAHRSRLFSSAAAMQAFSRGSPKKLRHSISVASRPPATGGSA